MTRRQVNCLVSGRVSQRAHRDTWDDPRIHLAWSWGGALHHMGKPGRQASEAAPFLRVIWGRGWAPEVEWEFVWPFSPKQMKAWVVFLRWEWGCGESVGKNFRKGETGGKPCRPNSVCHYIFWCVFVCWWFFFSSCFLKPHYKQANIRGSSFWLCLGVSSIKYDSYLGEWIKGSRG